MAIPLTDRQATLVLSMSEEWKRFPHNTKASTVLSLVDRGLIKIRLPLHAADRYSDYDGRLTEDGLKAKKEYVPPRYCRFHDKPKKTMMHPKKFKGGYMGWECPVCLHVDVDMLSYKRAGKPGRVPDCDCYYCRKARSA